MSSHDIQSDIKKYYLVFAALMVCTVLTVLAGYIKTSIFLGVTIALIIATFKASLVASFFMHLINERKSIYMTLILTAIFFVGMIALIVGAYYDVPQGTSVSSYAQHATKDIHHGEGGHHENNTANNSKNPAHVETMEHH